MESRRESAMSEHPQTDYEMEAISEKLVVRFRVRRLREDGKLPEVEDAVRQELSAHALRTVEFDLEQVRVVSSMFLTFLVNFHRAGFDVIVSHPSDEVRKSLEFTQLDRLIRIEDGDRD